MRVCQIVPSLEEKYGGPSRSVRALANALARLDHDVQLLATTPGDPQTHTQDRLRVHEFARGFPATLCPSRGLWRHLHHTPTGLIHHHSLWLRTLDYARRQAAATHAPLVISPRGMMSRWAWTHHAARKKLARIFVHPGAFEAAAGWHATSIEEADDIRALGFKQPICIAPNGVTAPTDQEHAAARTFWHQTCPETTQRPTALFYSRFHPKKRVLELIDLWLEQAPAEWLLLMVGLPEEYTAAQLEAYVMRASCAGRIRVFNGEGLPAPYAAAHVLLLPSHSENFGLVIAEAMANGLPAVVTDMTPWKRLNENHTGWCVPWADFPAAMAVALAEPPALRTERGRRARAYVVEEFAWEASARKLSEFYQELTSSRKQ